MEKIKITESELVGLMNKVIANEMKRKTLKETIKKSLSNVLKEDNIAYPKGGQISGQHQQPIKDKDFKSEFPAGKTYNQQHVDKEWEAKAIGRLFGVEWSQNPNPNVPVDWFLGLLESSIKSWKLRRSSTAPNNYASELEGFKYQLNHWRKEFSEHFGIDRDSDKSIISFLDHGTDSMLGNIAEYRKIMLQGRDGVQEAKKKDSKKKKFDKVMGEFGAGTLKTPNGKEVTDRKQALAIAYSESGLDEQKVKIYNILEGVLKENDTYKILLGVITSQKGNDWKIKADSNESFYVVRPLDGLVLQVPPEINSIGANRYGYEEMRSEIENLINKKEGGLIESEIKSINETKILITFVDGTESKIDISSNDIQFIKNNFGAGNTFTVDGKEKLVKNVDILREGVAQNNPKIEKYVNGINELIAQAVDSEGDPIGVVDPTSTWEEPYIYDPIVYQNGALKIVSRSNYQPGKINTDIVRSRDMELDGIPTLQLLSRMYKKALKNKNRESVNTDI